jgi:type I restriction enzyme M protein
MLTGEIRSQIDQIWNAFWSGGISDPLEVIEQITYLLFLKRLDEQEIAEELKANREKKPMQKRFFPEGKDSNKRSFQDYRWNRFKNTDPRDMYAAISEHAFPWLRTLGGNGTTYSKHTEGARFTIPTPALLAKVVDMVDKVPMEDRDTKGDLYESERKGSIVVN